MREQHYTLNFSRTILEFILYSGLANNEIEMHQQLNANEFVSCISVSLHQEIYRIIRFGLDNI